MGEAFGKYELFRRIGVGGMAEVFRAKTFGPEGFVKDVVIKRILPAFSEDPEFVQMFINEARIAARLQHANIVQIFDFNHADGIYYIAMEWVDGTDLKRILDHSRRRTMPVPICMAVHVGVEALKGLHYASTRSEKGTPLNLVHRDISPHNLLVSLSGEVKITDFGIAKVAALASASRAGMLKGKLAYMSPEQVSNRPLDGRSDIYSLGIVLWELLTGRRLYEGDSEGELFARVQRAEVPSPRTINDCIDEDLEQVVMRMLASSAADRYSTAESALGELSRFAKVGDTLEVAAYIRSLIPDLAGRDQVGDTSRLDAGSLQPPPVVSAGPDAPTRTIGAPREDAASKPSRVSPSNVSSSNLSSSNVSPSGVVSSAYRITIVVMCLGCFGVLGWWLSDRLLGRISDPGSVASLRVESRPSGTRLMVDGVRVGMTPVLVEGSAGRPLLIEGRRGETIRSKRKVLGQGQEHVVLSFERDAASESTAESTTTPAAKSTTNPAEKSTTNPAEKSAVSPAEKLAAKSMVKPAAKKRGDRRKATEGDRWGVIDVVVSPWAKIKINGRDVGHTPLRKYRLPPGSHRLELYNSELSKHESLTVQIVAGQKKTIRKRWH